MNAVGWIPGVLLAALVSLNACSAKTGWGGSSSGVSTGGAGAGPVGPGAGAATSSGSGGLLTGSAASGPGPMLGNLGGTQQRPMNMGTGPDGSCGELPFSAEQVTKTQTITHDVPQPIDLYIMWDQSLSMSCAVSSGSGGMGGAAGVNGATRWTAVKNPLSSWVQSVPAAPPFNVGIGYFGDSLLSSCDPKTYEKPDVEIAPLPMNGSAINASLNAHMPSTTTPTAPALSGAINHALAWKTSHPGDVVAIVLVTDGEPNVCNNGTVADVVNIAQVGWGNGAGVQTFVIGVTSPGTTCGLDPNPPTVADLDSVAKAGGTEKALVVDVTQDPAKALTDELNMIRKTITMTTTKTEVVTTKLACEYALPTMPMVATSKVVFDKDKVNVDFTSNHGMKEQVFRVDSLDKCGSTKALGWYYDNNDMPTKILMCPTACSSIQAPGVDGGVDPTVAGTAPKVDIVLGCKSLYAPPA